MTTYAEMAKLYPEMKSIIAIKIKKKKRLDGDTWTSGGTDYIYVADANNDRIKKHLCSDLSFVDEIGSSGSGDDQFDYPTDACSDGTYFYTTDAGSNDRIMKRLCSDLSYDSKIGSSGSGDDQFANPYSICTDNTYLYIVDTDNHRIVKRLCSDLSYNSKIGSSGSGDDQFSYPAGICTDGIYIYVSDSQNHRIVKRLCSDLSYDSKLGSSGSGDDQFRFPKDICTDGTYLYIADNANSRIKKHKCSDLSYVADESGSGANALSSPYGISTDGIYLYISDAGTDYIYKWLCSDLSYDSKIGGNGSGDDKFDSPLENGYSGEGYPNCYYISHTDGTPVGVKEGVISTSTITNLTERISLSDCNDNAGSWYWDSANQRLYVHTTGSDDPGNGDYYIMSLIEERIASEEGIEINGVPYRGYLNSQSFPDAVIEISGVSEGGLTQSFGSIVINNDGRYDTELWDYIYENCEIDVYIIGQARGIESEPMVLWSGWTGRVEWTNTKITINTEDLRKIASEG